MLPVVRSLLGTPTLRPAGLGARRLFSSLRVTAGLKEHLDNLLTKEADRQRKSLCLISSENIAPRYIFDCAGSHLMNKYSEGVPGARYYGGNEVVDEIERICQRRALDVFGLDPQEWAVNVQALSGTPANFIALSALCERGDRVMGLDLPHGGHLSHGFQTPHRKITASSKFFESMPYRLNLKTERIDYEELRLLAGRFRPKVIIAGTTAHCRHLDYAKFRSIADECGAFLLADMAHISGFVAGGVIPGPFPFADVVTTTTHKALGGPRGALVFSRKRARVPAAKGGWRTADLSKLIDASTFPGAQGGPHVHTIAAIAAVLKENGSDGYRRYAEQVLKNAKVMENVLRLKGCEFVSGGTDLHHLVLSLKNFRLGGAKVERVCEAVNISLNKNTLPDDLSALHPRGIRIGTPAMTSRGAREKDFEQIADFVWRAICTTRSLGGKNLAEMVEKMEENPPAHLLELQCEVEEFASSFPLLGVD